MKILQEWRVVPVTDGDICLLGELEDGTPWRTSSIVRTEGENAFTKSGTHYRLGRKFGSMWEFQLQVKRPDWFKRLEEAGTI